MGRFETLNEDSKDIVQCLVPALATAFGLQNAVDIIPQDIRMRAWDCERRDHIKDITENDPRNWGVQFLKDLMAISRIKNGDLAVFQLDLRAKVLLHEENHPWARLSDIRQIKDEYEHPNRYDPNKDYDSSSGHESIDSYFEELIEPDEPKRGRNGRQEVYEARIARPRKTKQARLRRTSDGGFQRPEVVKKRSRHSEQRGSSHHSEERESPRPKIRKRKASRTVHSEMDDSDDTAEVMFMPSHPMASTSHSPRPYRPQNTPAYSQSPIPHGAQMFVTESVDSSDQPLAVQKLHAELEVAEAELRAARLRYEYVQAKEKSEAEAKARTASVDEDDEHDLLN